MEVWVLGKSIDLLKVAYNYEERGHNVMLITADIDDRFENKKITTRIGLNRDAYTYKNDTNIYDMCINLGYLPACILVDEAQFLNKKQVEQLGDIVDYLNIPVICYGLRTDFKSNLFEGSSRLFEIADKIEEIKTICDCGKKATYNIRLSKDKPVTDGNQIMIGNIEYKALCGKCYKERTENGKK